MFCFFYIDRTLDMSNWHKRFTIHQAMPDGWHWEKLIRLIRFVTLANITGIIILVPYLKVKSLQIIWRSDTRSSTGARSSNELQRFDYMVGNQDSGRHGPFNFTFGQRVATLPILRPPKLHINEPLCGNESHGNLNPTGSEAGIFRASRANAIAAGDLVTCVTRPWTAEVLIMLDKRVHVVQEERQ